MGGESVEITAQPIGRRRRNGVRREAKFEVMHDRESVAFGPTANVEGGDAFAHRVEGEPEPRGGGGGTEAGIQLVQLHGRQGKVAEEEIVPALAVRPHPFEPPCEGRVGATGEAHQHQYIDAFRQKPEDEFDLFLGCVRKLG